MPIYLGADRLEGIHLGGTELAKVYLGTTLVYQKGGTPPTPTGYVLYDNGWVPGVSWEGNALPRKPYTSIATYNFAHADAADGGYMTVYFNCSPSYSAVLHNAHVCTAYDIIVPADATTMKVTYNESVTAELWSNICFGLLKRDCEAATVPSTGGIISEWISTHKALETVSLDISSLDKTEPWTAVVNFRHWADDTYPVAFNIFKVWFE